MPKRSSKFCRMNKIRNYLNTPNLPFDLANLGLIIRSLADRPKSVERTKMLKKIADSLLEEANFQIIKKEIVELVAPEQMYYCGIALTHLKYGEKVQVKFIYKDKAYCVSRDKFIGWIKLDLLSEKDPIFDPPKLVSLG